MTSLVEGAENILLRTQALNPGEAEACCELLSVAEPVKLNVLAVTYTQSASTWATEYQQHVGSLPEQLTIISVGGRGGEMTRSSAHGESAQPTTTSGEPVIEEINDPRDLTGLGIRISEHLKSWHEGKGNGGATQMTLCFDSLTALLQYTDPETAFQFLHTITGRISQVGAVAHYHLTPDAHPEQTVATLSTLFDAVRDVADDENR